MENQLDTLNDAQREMLNTFMAITAIENTSTAIQFLKMCDFNLEVKMEGCDKFVDLAWKVLTCQNAINTALETGGNIAQNQEQAAPPIIPAQPSYNDYNYEEQAHHQNDQDYQYQSPPRYVPMGVGQNMPTFSNDENEYYKYLVEKSKQTDLKKTEKQC